MQFNTYIFAGFVCIVLGAYFSRLPWASKKVLLLIASYLFYSAAKPSYLLLLIISTLIDWFVAKRMTQNTSVGYKKVLLFFSLAANLSMLGLFKYGDFLMQVVTPAMQVFGVNQTSQPFNLLLPMGISFYTFQSLSYTIDVYRGSIKPANSFFDYCLYIAFFPQLVSGPIVRTSTFLPQLKSWPKPSVSDLNWGATLFILGLFEKVVLADDFVAPAVDATFGRSIEQLNFMTSWITALSFGSQLFLDFAGYSSCAIGLCRMMGFQIPANFNYPLSATSISDFWKRWHISLSLWIRDYLYLPLVWEKGGNQLAALKALLITMTLAGLWHGAGWNFIVWGLFMGLFLVFEAVFRKMLIKVSFSKTKAFAVLTWGLTLAAMSVCWVLFRSPDLNTAWAFIAVMFSPSLDPLLPSEPLWSGRLTIAAGVSAILLLVHALMRHQDLLTLWEKRSPLIRGLILGLMLFCISISSNDEQAFIYFNF